MEGNKRIDQLPLSAGPKGHYFLAMRNMDTNVTEKVLVSFFIQSSSQNFEWVSDKDPKYQIDEVVTRNGRWYQSLINDNESIPGTDDNWQEISRSPAGLSIWQAGAYVDDVVLVLSDHTGEYEIYMLENATRPFVSSDIEAEELAGDWRALTGANSIEGVSQYYTGNGIQSSFTLTQGTLLFVEVGGQVIDPTEYSKTGNTITFFSPLGDGIKVGMIGAKGVAVMGGGGGTSNNRSVVFRFNSDLFTEQSLSFRGLISDLDDWNTNEIVSVSYESRLDSSSVWVSHASLSDLLTWINSNVTGTESSGTIYWIKCLATYGSGTGEAENTLRYNATLE